MSITSTLLKNLRIKKNITLDQLAIDLNEQFNINITTSMLSKWETGKVSPVYDHLKRLAAYYDVTTDYLLGFNHYENLVPINSNDNLDLDTVKKRIRNSKKQQNIAEINKLLEDDEFSSKDILFIKNFVLLLKTSKQNKTYK